MKTATRKSQPKFENRVRFNWGYWDGIADNRNGSNRVDGLNASTILDKHHDRAYAVGYSYGWYEANGGGLPKTSEHAWASAERNGAVVE